MMFQTTIDGRTFEICTRITEGEDLSSGQWFAWIFFAYDNVLNIYPADNVPQGIATHESIVGESGESEEEARLAVENKLRRVIQTKSLDGSGFYSPPAGKIYPQEFQNPE
jgi:hypothetical protein